MASPDNQLVPLGDGSPAGVRSMWLRYQKAKWGWHVVVPLGLGGLAGYAISWAWTMLDRGEYAAAMLFVFLFFVLGIGAAMALPRKLVRVVAILVVIGFASFSVAKILQEKGDKPWTALRAIPAPTPKPMPRCLMAIDSHVMSRLYTDVFSLRPELDDAEWTEWVKYQEVFYQWAVIITPEQHVPNLSITIDHLSLSDRLSVIPEDGLITEPTPRWVTGHSDPSSDPHYYARTIRFTDLSQDRVAKIVILRPVSSLALNQSVFQEMEVIRVIDAAAAACKIEIPAQDIGHDAQLVNKQIPSIVAHGNKGSATGVLPIKLAPKFTPAPWQARFEMELRCITDDCEKFEIGNCVVIKKEKSAIPVPQGK